MNTKKLLLNSVLALGLAGIGSAYAEEVAMPVQDREAVRAQHREEMAGMKAAEREQYRSEKQAEMAGAADAGARAKNEKNSAGKGANFGKADSTMAHNNSTAGSRHGGGSNTGGGTHAH